jgi:hypothetical protein
MYLPMRPVPHRTPHARGTRPTRPGWPALAAVLLALALVVPSVAGADAGATEPPATATGPAVSSSTSTTAPPSTSTTSTTSPAPPSAPRASGPPIDPAPLVTVSTMAQRGNRWGVQVDVVGDVSPDVWKCPELTPSTQGFSCFYADPSNGSQWVQLVVLDRRDLHLVANRNVACQTATTSPQENQFDIVRGGSDPWTRNANPCIGGLVQYVDGLNDGDLVIAVNQPGSDRSVQPPVGVAAALSGKFVAPFDSHAIGIAATDWFDAKDNGAHLPAATRGTFSAIGVPGWTDGGIAALAASPDQAGGGKLVASVAIDNSNRYAPLPDADAKDAEASPVTKVLTQASKAWPGSGNTAQMAALSFLGTKVDLGPNPRSQYYSSSRDGAAWQLVLAKIPGVAYVSNAQYQGTDLDWARKQLTTEIGFLIELQSYLDALAKPYQTASPTLWSDFGAVVAQVDAATSNGTTAKVLGLAREVLDAALEVVPVFGKPMEKVGAVALSAYHVALAVADAGGESAGESFSVESAQLASELTNRLNAAEQEIQLAWRKILAADFSKLQIVALCSSSDDGCPLPDDGWSVSLGQQAELKAVLQLGFERTLYTRLVPVKYPLALTLSAPGLRSPSMPSAGDWCRPLPPFTDATGLYGWQVHTTAYDPTRQDRDVVFWVPIAFTTGSTTSTWQAASWSVFIRMFTPVDPGGNIAKGGLGIDEREFIKAAYSPTFRADDGRPVTSAHVADNQHFISLVHCAWP